MDKIKVKVLGCGDAFSSGGRFNTSFFVSWKQKGFLLDCGPATLTALKKAGLNTNDIDVIFISHFHGDHYAGLPFILLDALLMQKREKPLLIYTPSGGKDKIKKLGELLYPGVFSRAKNDNIKITEYKSEEYYKLFDAEFIAYPVVHSDGTLPHGYRIKLGEQILAFSGDTGWTDSLFKISKGADLFLCECNFKDSAMKSHLSFTQIKDKLKDFNCKRIVLTHLGDEMLNFKTDLAELAYDGMEIEF